MRLNQDILNEFILYLKKEKYKNKIQDLKLEYCTDENGKYIYLTIIKIKKSQRNKGYGNVVLNEIIQLADKYNVRIKLWATNLYGSDLKRLYEFYGKHGFFFLEDNDGGMIYHPQKIAKIL